LKSRQNLQRAGFAAIGILIPVFLAHGALWPALGGEIVIRFGGDVMLGEHYQRQVRHDTLRAFRNFDLLKTADIAMVNLECPVTIRGERVEKPFNFRMQPGFLRTLVDAGIDLVTIANNHIYDYDSTGLFDTIVELDSAGVRHVGAGRTRDEAHRPVVFEIHGKKLAFLGYYGGGEAPPATASSPGVAVRALEVIQEDVRNAREREMADFVFVNLHWGVEKADVPDIDQVMFARNLVESGVDVIIGHHPHVWQGVERYKSGIIAYSIGNFIFGGNSRNTYNTALLEIRIRDDGVSHSIRPITVVEWNAREMIEAEALKTVQQIESLPITRKNQ
jgi:poly-gamma-glutamate synthesis protein (capsule biosynthesis protein)